MVVFHLLWRDDIWGVRIRKDEVRRLLSCKIDARLVRGDEVRVANIGN